MTQPYASDPPAPACAGSRSALLGIGDLARGSGLPASALRFYDREGVLVPAEVDATTGYRRYAPGQLRAARLVASLRGIGMALSDVREVLARDAAGDADAARAVVLAHEQRLVDGLQDARREVTRTLALLDGAGSTDVAQVVTVRAGELAEALRAVRFAVAPGAPAPPGAPGSDRAAPGRRHGAADLSVLTGVLVEVADGDVRVVATDRYRMAATALRCAPGDVHPGVGSGVRSVVAPVSWVDAVVVACAEAAEATVRLEVGAGSVRVVVGDGPGAGGGRTFEASGLPGTYPDHGAVLDGVAPGPALDAAGLADDLPLDTDRVGLAVVGDRVVVVPDEVADVLVDTAFLHEALVVAGGAPRLVLDGTTRPLAVRGPGRGLSVLMPVRPPASGEGG